MQEKTTYIKLECGPTPNVLATVPNTSGALCEIFVIPFFVARRKFWLTAASLVPCSDAANIGERNTWTQSEFCTWQNSVRGKSLQNVYIVYKARKRPNNAQGLVGYGKRRRSKGQIYAIQLVRQLVCDPPASWTT